MLLMLFSLGFIWLIFRELTSQKTKAVGLDTFDYGYIIVLLCLAITAAWHPLKYWRFERMLSQQATTLTGKKSEIHCNTVVDSIFDTDMGARNAGLAYFETGKIVFQYKWCAALMNYIGNPAETASRQDKYSLMLFTHEVMHIKGEHDEQKTECQAIQRNHIAGELLGIPKQVAKLHTLEYFHGDYKRHPYYSESCGPNKKLDEHLEDSIWSL